MSGLEHNQVKMQDEHRVFQEKWVKKKKNKMDSLPDKTFEHVDMSFIFLSDSLG